MKWWLLSVVGLFLSACATTHAAVPLAPEAKAEAAPMPLAAAGEPDVAAQAHVRRALEALPRCQAGADVGHLVVRATVCTKMFCDSACCNRCGWAATYESMSGAVEADRARVQTLLGLPESALDCEIAAWGRALAGQSLALDAPSCVVR